MVGVPTGACYAIGTFNLLPGLWSAQAFMLFGPLLVVCAYGIRAHFSARGDGVLADLGALLMGIAGVVFCLMATMQQSIYHTVPRLYRESAGPDAQTWDAILRSVSSTQLGLDYAFALFVSAAVLLLSLHMLVHASLPRALGVFGLLVALAGLAANALAFPENAELAGGIDPAPAFAVWFGLTWLALLWARLRPRPAPSGKP